MNIQQKTVIALGSFVAGILLFLALVIIPLLQGLVQHSKGLEGQYQEAREAMSAKEHVAEFLSFTRDSGAKFTRLENLLVDPETPIPFIEFLEGIAGESGFLLKITPGDPENRKGSAWPVMEFQLGGTLSYPDLVRFLEKLEVGPYLLQVQNVSLNRLGKGEVSFTLLAEVFTSPIEE